MRNITAIIVLFVAVLLGVLSGIPIGHAHSVTHTVVHNRYRVVRVKVPVSLNGNVIAAHICHSKSQHACLWVDGQSHWVQ